MPKKATSKSQSIRDHLAKNPADGPKAVKAALTKKGIDVSEALVGVVKYGPGSKTAGRGRGRRGRAGQITASELLSAKKLIDELGGINETRKALDVLEKLS